MNNRGPRLGGIVDDYCPRERRVTDHAIVAMVEDEIKQTRCTTCDEEHPYKEARVPVSRRKKSTLYDQVLEQRSGPGAPPPEPSVAAGQLAPRQTAAPPTPGDDGADGDEPEATPAPEDGEARVHRRLIRATLPRQEGQIQPRPLPEFTIRQNGSGYANQYRDQESRRPLRGGQPSGSDNGQPGSRRPQGAKARRHFRHSDDTAAPFSGAPGQRSGQPGQRPAGRSKSRSRRRHAGGKKHSK